MNQEAITYVPQGIGHLAEALAKAQAEIGPAKLDKTNPHFRSQYASLASVMEAARPIYQHGLSLVQMPTIHGDQVVLTTRLMHSSGEYIESQLSGPIGKGPNQVQAMGSTLSYLRRYAVASMLGIASGDDDDGNSSTSDASPRQNSRGPREQSSNPPPRQAPHRAQETRDNHPTTVEVEGANQGYAPPAIPPGQSVPEKLDPDTERKRFFAVAGEKGLTKEQGRCLLGVSSRADATPRQFRIMAEALKSWGENERKLVLEAVTATSQNMMELAWKALPEETAKLILEACKFRKQSLVEAGVWGLLADPDSDLEEGKCKGCGASIWWAKTAKSDKAVPLDQPLRRAMEPHPDFPQEEPRKLYALGPDGKVSLVDTYRYREGDNWIKGYLGHHVSCPEAEQFRKKEAA